MILASALALSMTACPPFADHLRRTPRAERAALHGGWRSFRWGMAAGDVQDELLGVGSADALRSKNCLRLEHVDASDVVAVYMVAAVEMELRGRSINAYFYFLKERLFKIELRPRDERTPHEELVWRDELLQVVSTKYGAPSWTTNDYLKTPLPESPRRTTVWERPDLLVCVIICGATDLAVELWYADPVAIDAADVAMDQSKQRALGKEAGGL